LILDIQQLLPILIKYNKKYFIIFITNLPKKYYASNFVSVQFVRFANVVGWVVCNVSNGGYFATL